MMFVAPARTETPICREHIDLPEKKHLAVFVLVRRAPASCLGFYSQNMNTLRPTLGSLCFGQASACIAPWILLTEREHFETNTWQFFVLVTRAPASRLGFFSRNVNTLRPTLGSFCFGQAIAGIAPWILLTECEHFETNTRQFLFWSGERLHLALGYTHRM